MPGGRRYWWLILRPDDIEVCLKNPELPIDVVVAADLGAFTRVWLGHQGPGEALAAGTVASTGPAKGIATRRRILGVAEHRAVKTFTFQGRAATA